MSKLISAKQKPHVKVEPVSFGIASPRAVYGASRTERVQFIRMGVPAAYLDQIAGKMAIPKELLYKTLRLPRSTVDRKLRANDNLSPEHSERVIGLERLIGQLEAMMAESGDGSPFDAHVWIGDWLESPLPALGGAKPADYMDTMEGQEMVSSLLAQAQSGAYA
jgi:putative toxin-antitoxin system antitoxin component (TIGR02293 family)